MKNNTKSAKINLEQALKNIPNDFALSEVKRHIRIALDKINEVENKREKREKLKVKREELKLKRDKKLKLNPNSIYIIDAMIEEQTKKLNNLIDE